MGLFHRSEKRKSSSPSPQPEEGCADLPPSYDYHRDDGDGDDDEVPAYFPPTAGGVAADGSTSLATAMAKLPPVWNFYVTWKLNKPCYIGTSAEDKLFAVSFPQSLFHRTANMILHDGPDSGAPALAEAWCNAFWTKNWIRLFNHPMSADSADGAVEVMTHNKGRLGMRPARRFTMDVETGGNHKGGEGGGSHGLECHEFEWRDTHGDEIKRLTGLSSGYKLVWLTGPDVGPGGSRAARGHGTSGDGKEVVAVLALNNSWSMHKWLKFSFLGTGLTGRFGAAWEAMAALSGLRVWHIQQQSNANAASASSASAASAAAVC